jgi:hypothetical protein
MMLADVSLNGFGAFVVVAVTVLTIGLGAVGIFMQRRSSAIIAALKEEREIADRERDREREKDRAIMDQQGTELAAVKADNVHLNEKVNGLNEMVTQAAKVDLLRGEVQTGFTEVLKRLPIPA